MKLVIVESPAKAKTIEKFLGPDYRVVASYGHIRDLPGSASEIPATLKGKSWARLAVDTDGDFRPVYIVPPENQKRVAELKKELKKADEILLATDEDREGESISWHLLEVLKPTVPVRRITFHEITRSAIQKALENPRDVDQQLVSAQEARRVLDRLYGYTLSPVLWKKVRTKLSAGRVQSVALRLIVEREEERQAFKSSAYWDVVSDLGAEGDTFSARLVAVGGVRVATSRDFDSTTGEFTGGGEESSSARILDQLGAEAIAAGSRDAVPWTVVRVEPKETRQRPSAPFTTSTLQQAASNQLRMSPKRAMRVAQTLYEGVDMGDGDREGLITYMRTDSVTLSELAIEEAGRLITRTFGDEYYTGPRHYKTKAKSAQEAHEAIRPTELSRTPETVARFLDQEELALYRLIWSQAVGSQMADAILDRTTVDMRASFDGTEHVFRANGSILRFAGFLKVMGGQREDALLPDLREGQSVGTAQSGIPLQDVRPDGHETRPPPRFTEAALVKRLEEEGIGRPSTYTPTISTIQDRQYVVKKGSALVPTYVGMAVIRLLRNHFEHYIDLAFTAKMEDTLDDIAAGDVESTEFLARFYRGENGVGEGLVSAIEKELPLIDYPAIPVGLDPETSEEILVRIGRNHVYVQRGAGEEGDRATLPVDLLIDELTPEKAVELLKARERSDEPLGTDEDTGQSIYLRAGPYGPYVQLGEAEEGVKPKRVSLPKGMEIEDVSLEYARRLISLPRLIGQDPETGEDVLAGLGRYGPYVSRARTFRNVESVDRLFEVGLEEAVALINEKKQAKGKTVIRDVGPHPESGATIQIFEGRYGPYVSDGKGNASLGKTTDPADVDVPAALVLLAEAAKRKKKGGARRGASRRSG